MSKRNSKKEQVRSEDDREGSQPEPSLTPDDASSASADGRTDGHHVGGNGASAAEPSSHQASGGDDPATASAESGSPGGETEVTEGDPTQRVAELKDELLRRQADYENFRKRMNRDKEEAIKFANSALLMDLTAIIDDFERAIQSSQDNDDVAALRSGLELIEKQLTGMLERKWGLSRFSSAGEPFDPERHEALAQEPSADHEVATVVEDYQKGFLLHGRVVRAARVRVATPATDQSPASADDGSVAAEDHSSDSNGDGTESASTSESGETEGD